VHPEVAARATPTAMAPTKRRNTGCEVIDHMLGPLPGGAREPPPPRMVGGERRRAAACHPPVARSLLPLIGGVRKQVRPPLIIGV
jgi:hypothetical protein